MSLRAEVRNILRELADIHLFIQQLASGLRRTNQRLAELEEKVRRVNSRTY